MIYNSHNLNVYRIADHNGSRPMLTSIFFRPDRTVATDSIRLLEVSTPKADIVQFPKVLGKTAMRSIKPFLVNAQELWKLAGSIKINRSNIAISHLDDNRAEFMCADDQTLRSITRVDDKFPDYEKIFPVGKPLAEVTLNAGKLAEMLKVMSNLDEKVTIKVYGPERPVQLECKTADQSMKGLIMPIKQ